MSAIIAERLARLRAQMAARHLDGFLVPMADEYQNEYVPPSAQRVAFITGFTGSSGFAAILRDKAGFFTDSRYTLQARQQLAADQFAQFDITEKAPGAWLAEQLGKDARLGYDPWLHSVQGLERLRQALPDVTLAPVTHNLVDVIWSDRPAPASAPVTAQPLAFAGESSAAKRAALAQDLKDKDIAALVVTNPASVAWLLNVRGGDVPYTPLPLSFALLRADASVDWFIDARKLEAEPPDLAGIRLYPPAAFLPLLRQFTGQKVQIDPVLCAAAIVEALAEAAIIRADDPCALPRACKNQAEQKGMRAAHRRDGAALAQFFSWLAAQPPGTVTELQVEEKLEAYRAAQNLYCGPSFATIAGSGPHGAIVHYRATAESNRTLQSGELLLLDSGGQYRDGTTDVTRTIAIGAPSAMMRTHYTLVVKGHIALASIRFPAGMTGADLDVLARQYLWAAGLDYGHGTGHGVGAYLGVHEGPQNISRRSQVKLQPGMVLSNEPGYYRAGDYGIRFENLMLVTEAATLEGGEMPTHGFEILTLAPLEPALLDLSRLTGPEIAWIDEYHAQVRDSLADQLDEPARRWLLAMTAPLTEGGLK